MMPLVTLAITTLNRPRFLHETLASALAQDYANLDILVSDNGSTDTTPVLTKALVNSDPRVRLRRNETTVPLHEHFTQCVEAARGKYFVLLHDDDRINSSFVSEVVGVVTRHPDVNVVVPANVMMDEQGATIREYARPSCEVFDGPRFVCDWLGCREPHILIDVTTILMRTEVIRRFGGYQSFEGGRNIDNLLFLQCAITSRVGFAERARFYWRSYPESYGSRATPKEIADSGRAYRRHLRRDPEAKQALAALPSSSRNRILRSVLEANVGELVYHMRLHEGASRWRTAGTVLSNGRKDIIFLYAVLCIYLPRAWLAIYQWLHDVTRRRLLLSRNPAEEESGADIVN
jgi:glycosyltransferase involved in cell wall biosynthesis